VVSWTLAYTRQAQKDAKKFSASGLRGEAERLLEILKKDSYQRSPPFERLQGDRQGAMSRRINIQHRLVYQALEKTKTVKVIRMWTHYE